MPDGASQHAGPNDAKYNSGTATIVTGTQTHVLRLRSLMSAIVPPVHLLWNCEVPYLPVDFQLSRLAKWL